MNLDDCSRPISDITDQELKDLISNQEENQWIDFKQKDYHQDPNDQEKHKREICKDVTAMGNADGGYIIIGVGERDGLAKGFFTVDNPDKTAESINSICLQYIDPRIPNLEVQTRSFEWNDSNITLVIIHIPPSDLRPHGIVWQNSIQFVKRYGDLTREYRMSELGEAFSVRHYPPIIGQLDDKLDTILRHMRRNRRSSMSPEDDALDQDDVGSLLRLMQLRFKKAISGEPYFRIFAVPTTALPNPDAMPTDEEEVRGILKDPPTVRPSGFGVMEVEDISSSAEGIYGSSTWNDCEVILLRNAFLELRIPLSGGSFQWRKAECRLPSDSSWLYPYAVCEYPVAFMMLVAKLYSTAAIDSDIVVQQEYHNLNGFILVRGHPGDPFFGSLEHHRRIYNSSEPIVSKQTVNQDFVPDRIAFDLVKPVYASFELNEDTIPLFDENHNFTP